LWSRLFSPCFRLFHVQSSRGNRCERGVCVKGAGSGRSVWRFASSDGSHALLPFTGHGEWYSERVLARPATGNEAEPQEHVKSVESGECGRPGLGTFSPRRLSLSLSCSPFTFLFVALALRAIKDAINYSSLLVQSELRRCKCRTTLRVFTEKQVRHIRSFLVLRLSPDSDQLGLLEQKSR
jgi:hypothetical protein